MRRESLFNRRRMYRLFRGDGRCLVVAMDHGSTLDVFPALNDTTKVVDAVIAGGADAILTTPGIAREFFDHLKSIGLILRVDGWSADAREKPECNLLFSVEDALRLGADAVACMGYVGTPLECQTLGNLAKVAAECHAWGVPLLAEMLAGGFTNPELRTPENTRRAARIGAELGADIIKTEFTGPGGSFQQVTEHCYRPVLVLGGSKRDDDRGLLEMVKSALEAGASGVAIGRNIWGHSDPQALVKALSRLIHHDGTVDEALKVLAGGR